MFMSSESEVSPSHFDTLIVFFGNEAKTAGESSIIIERESLIPSSHVTSLHTYTYV